MADLSALLASLEHDPDDASALAGLVAAAQSAASPARTQRFAAARKTLTSRGRPDGVLALLEAELAVTSDPALAVPLLLEKGLLLDSELLDVAGARAAFVALKALTPDDALVAEAVEDLDLGAANWQKFAAKYVSEASASTDRSLATSLFLSAAEAHGRYAPDSIEAEAYLRKALEIEPRNSKAAFHLVRHFRRGARWSELAALLEQRAELAPSVDEKVAALLLLAQVGREHLGADGATRATVAVKRALQLDPAQPRALREVTEGYAATENWPALVTAYQAALKARRDGDDLGILLQISMTLWKHIGDLDQAEEMFRRVRKLEPAHPAALDFYRAYYPARGEHAKLLALLRQVGSASPSTTNPMGVEIAQLAEAQNNPEKAIEAWKQVLRADPGSSQAREARTALGRLYRRTEKWNALLDLMKDELERIPERDVAARVEKLHEVVEIYRDRLKLDVMVINTFNAILKLDPENERANTELAGKFRVLGRWNDLIAVLTRKSEVPDLGDGERVALLREIADLWSERFGNFANAIRPLERIVEVAPASVEGADALARLKEIYTKRRQWRALIDVLGREAGVLPEHERRAKLGEMARLAAERLGDSRLAIEIYNGILADSPGQAHPETLVALAALYEREKRWLPLAEILHRQSEPLIADPAQHKDAIALLDKLGTLYAERAAAPQVAAEVWQQVLRLDPQHAKALRTLRELYATAGDFAGLEALYARLGQGEELVDALLVIADRLEGKAARLPLVERAAQLAQQRADAAATATAVDVVALPAAVPPTAATAATAATGTTSERRRRAPPGQTSATAVATTAQLALERARQVWERVLAVDPANLGAAVALSPIYTQQEKWARLLAVHEIELATAPDAPRKLAVIARIRALCEHKLASRTLAFSWTLRAFELDPASPQLFADVLRLAQEPAQWREVATQFEAQLGPSSSLGVPQRLTIVRELARIAMRRLDDPERARGYHRQILELVPDDRDAEQHLEELAVLLADWHELLASYRQRAAREQDAHERASLLIEIASLQEEKLGDLDGAAATYQQALDVLPGQVRALRALARIEEARGDWPSLAKVLDAELAVTSTAAGGGTSSGDPGARFELLMRLGALEEQRLGRPARALAYYRDALAIPAAPDPASARGDSGRVQLLPGVRPLAIAAIARFVGPTGPGTGLAEPERVAAARLVRPHLEATRQSRLLAEALTTIRTDSAGTADERLELDRQLMRLHHVDLGDPAAAWQDGLRVLAADPSDADVRGSLGALAGQLGRDGEWARHLAGALDALRTRGGTPADVRAVATELARLATDRLGDPATAERAWKVVLEHFPDAADAFEALTVQLRGTQRWEELRALLERGAAASSDDRVKRAVLLELAGLEEDILAEPVRAIAAHRRVLESDPGYLGSYQALDRLLTGAAQWTELEALLARQADHAKSPRDHLQLSYRRAELFAHRLGEPVAAVELLEAVIGRARDHQDARELLEELLPASLVTMRVARLLEPLYEQDKLWRDLVGVLRAQRAFVTGTEAVEVLARIATIEEAELAGARNAFDAWTDVLALDPTHERARGELARLAQQLSRWPEATRAFETAAMAAPAGDVTTRSALLAELASYYDTQLGDTQRAIATYRRMLDTDPSNPSTVRRAAGALARLYEETASWTELRGVLRKLSEWIEDPGERRTGLARVAALEETQLADRAAAIGTWRDVLADHPADPGALDALERLYEAADKWRDLIDILRRKVELGAPARPLLARIAEIHEVVLEEPHESVAIHLELLDRDAADRGALGELARLYRTAQRHADLLEILERQASHEGTDAGRIGLQIQSAQLLAGPLARPADALDRWATVLDSDPEHPVALAAVERGLADPELRLTAAAVLQPVYEATSRHDRLAALFHQTAGWTDDVTARMRALAVVVRLREYQLDDRRGAFDAQVELLRSAATEPELAEAIAETERLAGELGAEGELIDVYREVAPTVLDAELQRRLYLDVADLARALRQDRELAREYYQRVLDGQPDDHRALAALESIYREANDFEHLTEVLLRQADAAVGDADERVVALVEAAGLYVQLGRPDDAISTWEQVIATAPERRDAVDALEILYRAQGRWPDVVDLYERRLGFATKVEEAVGLRVQLGQIHEQHLRDFETAIDNFGAALGGDPRDATALAAVERYLIDPDLRAVAAEVLEPIYVGQQKWHELVRVYEARLEGATEPRERLRLTRFVARLYEEQLEDFDSASRWYARVFRESPGDPAVRDQLARLATMIDNWGFVAQTYQQLLDDDSGESAELRDVAITVAGIYDRRLGEPDLASAAYGRALAMAADDTSVSERDVLQRLEDVLGRASKWDALVGVYEEMSARADDELRLEMGVKRARVLETAVGDPERAIGAWRDVRELVGEPGDDPVALHAHREAVLELERLYTSSGRWRDVVDLYEARLARSQQPHETAELRLRLASLLEMQLGEVTQAIDQYEHVVAEGTAWERAVSALERLVVVDEHRERIAELLEPVYREQDWWQKLVVILDAKLAYIRDPRDQVTVLHEIARIHEERGGALDLALQALARAWRLDLGDEESLSRLLALAVKLAAWDEMATTLEAGATASADPDQAASLWARAAEVHEARRADPERAIAAWRQVTQTREDDMVALAALDRLLAAQGRTAELVSVIARRAELTDDLAVRLVLLHRVAALHDEVLANPVAAVAAYKTILAADDTDEAALDALERLLRSAIATGVDTGRLAAARELASILERKIEISGDVTRRQALRHAAATVYEQQLADTYQAVGQLTAVLDDDAGEPRALAELDRLYSAQKLWPELLDIVDRRALLAAVQSERAELAYRAAHLVEAELLDVDGAVPRYSAVLTMLPGHAPARAALEALMSRDELVEATTSVLERVYRSDRDAAGLVRVYERRIAADVGDRATDWAALADVHETLASAPGAAFSVWARAILQEPDDAALLAPLVRLATSQGLWRELAELLQTLLASTLPPDVDQAYALRLGEVVEERLGELPRAAQAYERAATGPDPGPALAALERVFARDSRWSDLAIVLRRQADATDDEAQLAALLVRLADLQGGKLGDRRASIAAYREVLGIVPTDPDARAALERILRDPGATDEQRTEIVEVLEPLFEADGDASRLLAVLEARLIVTADPIDRASLLARMVELAEARLGDRGRALEMALRWLAADPGGQALAEVERLAEQLGQWSEVAARLQTIIDAPDAQGAVAARERERDIDVQVTLLMALGKIQRDRLEQLDEAAQTYRAVLALEPEGTSATAALDEVIAILRLRGDQHGLAQALQRRGELAAEPYEKRQAFAEVARLAERAGDRPGAIAAWRAVLDADETDRETLTQLARLHRAGGEPGDRSELSDILARTARYAASPIEEKQLRTEIAQLESESPRAAAAWQAVLDLDPDDLAALAALQTAHTRASDWVAVADIQSRRLGLARSSWDKVAIHAEMASIAEVKRGSVDDAVASWFAALDVDPAHLPAYAELERLLGSAGRWHDVVELLERLAELHATLGDGRAELATLARAADVWEGMLENPDAAGEILEKILVREPTSIAALTRLSKLHERAGDAAKSKSTLEQALRLGPTGTDAADLFFRLGEVALSIDGDLDTARLHYQQALKQAPAHAESIAALEKIARAGNDVTLLADMLQRRVTALSAPSSGAGAEALVVLLVELADLEHRAGTTDAALVTLARAANAAPDDARVLGPLADLFFASGRLDEAAPIYDRLAAEARTARRMKDVARFRQRQGSILEARADAAGALVAYEEALRVNPTDVTTMAGLGRLYFAGSEWEKARKIYQSLALQNLDEAGSAAGMSKGDIYWHLGHIQLALENPPKARSMFQRGLELEPANHRLREALADLGD